MPPDTKRELFLMIIMISAIGLVLIVTLVLLMGAWRRHLARNKVIRAKAHAKESPDIWQISGQRLLAEMSAGSGGEHLGSDGDSDSDFEDPDDQPDDHPDDKPYDDGYPRENPF